MRQIISTLHVRRFGCQSQSITLNVSNFSAEGQHEFCARFPPAFQGRELAVFSDAVYQWDMLTREISDSRGPPRLKHRVFVRD